MASIEEAINHTLDELCDELLKLKKSYFSPKGKPGAGWKPLKESTLRTKRYKNPETYNSFNTATGQLRDSLEVNYERTSFGARITIQSNDDAVLVNYLTKTLGRDFMEFGDLEKAFIIDRFKRLLVKNVTKA